MTHGVIKDKIMAIVQGSVNTTVLDQPDPEQVLSALRETSIAHLPAMEYLIKIFHPIAT